MVPMPSPDAAVRPISHDGRVTLLQIALRSIREGLASGRALRVDSDDFPEELRAQRACFVTLQSEGDLRGCIGHLQAVQPLVCDVSENAFSAAFRDPRFAPLSAVEIEGLEVHISVLTPPSPMSCSSEQALLHEVRPGVDGLILEDGAHRGTFLPSVWESLPDPRSFVQQLKRKAGLPTDYWSEGIRVSRYQTEAFSSGDTA